MGLGQLLPFSHAPLRGSRSGGKGRRARGRPRPGEEGTAARRRFASFTSHSPHLNCTFGSSRVHGYSFRVPDRPGACNHLLSVYLDTALVDFRDVASGEFDDRRLQAREVVRSRENASAGRCRPSEGGAQVRNLIAGLVESEWVGHSAVLRDENEGPAECRTTDQHFPEGGAGLSDLRTVGMGVVEGYAALVKAT
jgi:hypothetical protein